MVATFPPLRGERTHPASTESGPPDLPRVLPSLTGLRFWAAALVVAYHITNHMGAVSGISDLVKFGRTGVTFFFVLSGFVLTWTYLGRATPLTVYFWRRFVRIWPLHVMTTLLTMGVYVWTGNRIANELTFNNLWPAFLLIHTWFPSPAVNRGGSGASWSLGDEMFFYAVFPLLLTWLASLTRWRRLLWVPPIMVGVSIALWLAIPMDGIGPYYRVLLLDYFPLSRVVQFISGVAIAIAIRRGWRCPVPVPAAVLVVLVFHAALVPWSNTFERTDRWYPYSASQLLALIPFALLIASVATSDLRGRSSHLARPSFVLLGQASFAWYLLHGPGILAYIHLVGKPESMSSLLLGWGVVAVGTQAISILAFLGFERPLERALRGVVSGKKSAVFAPS